MKKLSHKSGHTLKPLAKAETRSCVGQGRLAVLRGLVHLGGRLQQQADRTHLHPEVGHSATVTSSLLGSLEPPVVIYGPIHVNISRLTGRLLSYLSTALSMYQRIYMLPTLPT